MLKFYPAPGALVRVPGSAPVVGDPAPYVGREFDRANRAYPATGAAFEVAPNTDVARRLCKLAVRDRSVIPADAATAAACGIAFVPHELVDGEFQPAAVVAEEE